MYCPNCGKQIPEGSKFCPECGMTLGAEPANVMPSYSSEEQNPEDGSHAGYNFLAFLCPLAGWILYFVWRDKYPIRASKCSMWAWISFSIGLVLNLITMCSY